MSVAQETVLEISMSALEHNYRYLRGKMDPEVKFMAVVKASAYGSDVVCVARRLIELGADYLAVAYTSEGVQLREAGILAPVMVFHPQSARYQQLIEYSLEPNLYSAYNLNSFLETAREEKLQNYPVHIKMNTGMNRLGFSFDELDYICEILLKNPELKASSVFSHLAASEDWKEREFSLQQIHLFHKMGIRFLENLPYRPLFHICNTSGIINYPEAAFDMVRIGIGLQGYGNDPEEDRKLRPIGTLKSIISQIHELQAGDSVGYNRAFKASSAIKTATLPIGYADGIGRAYGNQRAGVFIDGVYAPIIGNVCMDMMMVDVTGIDCQEGDEVIIIGNPQSASSLAEKGQTISYELITRIAPRVKRIIVK